MTSRAVIFGLATAIILTGCTATAEPAATTASVESSSTAIPSPTPSVDASTEPASLELSTEALRILTDDGTEMESFSYFEPIEDSVIAALTSAIGSEPTVVDNAMPTYEWDGALLTVVNSTTDTEYANWTLTVSAPTVGALSAATDSGISVGSTREAAEAAGAILDETGTEVYYRLGITKVDRLGNQLPFCLYLGASADAITSIGGPSHENRG